MIQYIKILIINGYNEKEYNIDCNKKIININGYNKEIEEYKINDLINFFLSWDSEYSSNKIIDGEEYYVIVTTDSEITKFHGKGEYPKNYNSFKNFLGEL